MHIRYFKLDKKESKDEVKRSIRHSDEPHIRGVGRVSVMMSDLFAKRNIHTSKAE